MQIDQITISNFKLFAQQEYQFHPAFNLIVGVNGSGKTSLLRAVAAALGGWAHAYIKDPKNRRPITDDERREVQRDKVFDKTKTVRIEAQGGAAVIDRFGKRRWVRAVWQRQRVEGSDDTSTSGQIDYGNGRLYNLKFDQLGQDILDHIDRGNSFDLPVIAFYECDRLWLPKGELSPEESATTKHSRFDPYVDCFHTGADHRSLGQWLLKHELASLQQKVKTPTFLSIQSAATAALEGCTGLRFNFDESRVMVEFEDGHDVAFDHLSDGQGTMLGLFCDLAQRTALLNPHLGGHANAQTTGVVLIDELDLHLHPKWQRGIIESLRRTFPKIQFICTTHSPFLIQSLRDGKLIRLDDDDEPAVDYHDQSIEDIVEHVQGVDLPQKSQRCQDMMQAAERFYALLREGRPDDDSEIVVLKRELDALSMPFSDDPAFQALLKLERTAALGPER